MTIILNGTTGITNDGGYTGDGVSFADTTPSNTLVTTTGGNVGIGTSSPAAKLNVSRTDSTLIGLFSGTTRGARIGTNSTYSFIEGVDNTGSASYQPFMIGGSDVRFTTSDVERMRIDSSGNLLVGTTSLDPTLDRVSGLRITPSGSIYARANNPWDLGRNVTSGQHISFYTDNGSSRVSAGNISSNGSTTTYSTSSDYRMKTDVQPMTNALNKVMQLNPVTYKWVNGLGGTKENGEGFIAHELQAVVPDCVTGEKDAVETYTDEDGNEQTRIKPQGIDTSFLVATLTAAIQEQQAIITDLKARLETLEAK
tara:strand:- start:271 stop:1203 length:933 start_codon:yes stop_codon:yes gene_type:complete